MTSQALLAGNAGMAFEHERTHCIAIDLEKAARPPGASQWLRIPCATLILSPGSCDGRPGRRPGLVFFLEPPEELHGRSRGRILPAGIAGARAHAEGEADNQCVTRVQPPDKRMTVSHGRGRAAVRDAR